MSVNTVSADRTVLVAANTEATQSTAQNFQVLLPQIDAGAGATVAVGYELRLTTTGFGGFEILDFNLARVGFVPGHSNAIVAAEAGEAEGAGTPQQWRFGFLPAAPGATIADVDVDLAVDMAVDAAVDFDTSLALAAEATDSPLRADVDTAINAANTKSNANAVKYNAAAVKYNAAAVKLNAALVKVNLIIGILDGAGYLKTE